MKRALLVLLLVVCAICWFAVVNYRENLRACKMVGRDEYCCALIGGYKNPQCVEWRKKHNAL